MPKRWVEEVRTRVDEVWAPSEAARAAFVASGVAPDLVHVVPNGIDPAHFTPEGPARALPTQKSTVLLFVGGMTYRKGIDILLEAYGRAFTSDDDVCLVLKSFGSRTFYKGQTADDAVRAFQSVPGSPELVLLDEDLSFDEIPALYRACDVLVQPYRGEGFCLPALEALACGRPVIVTDGGSTDDFVPAECGWRVPSRRVPLPDGSLPPELRAGGRGLPARAGPRGAGRQPSVPLRIRPSGRCGLRTRASRPSGSRGSGRGVSPLLASRRCAIAGRSVRSRRPPCPTGAASSSSSPPTGPSERRGPGRCGPTRRRSGPATTRRSSFRRSTRPRRSSSRAPSSRRAGTTSRRSPTSASPTRARRVTEALELAADAMICANGYRPTRARLVIPPDPAALRAAAGRR